MGGVSSFRNNSSSAIKVTLTGCDPRTGKAVELEKVLESGQSLPTRSFIENFLSATPVDVLVEDSPR